MFVMLLLCREIVKMLCGCLRSILRGAIHSRFSVAGCTWLSIYSEQEKTHFQGDYHWQLDCSEGAKGHDPTPAWLQEICFSRPSALFHMLWEILHSPARNHMEKSSLLCTGDSSEVFSALKCLLEEFLTHFLLMAIITLRADNRVPLSLYHSF